MSDTPHIDAQVFFSQAAIDRPEDLFQQMRTLGPVCQIGETRAFWVGAYSAVEQAVKRNDDFSANLNGMLISGDDNKPTLFDLAAIGAANTVIANADEPDHAIHRKLMLPPLKASRIAELEPELRDFAKRKVQQALKECAGNNSIDICKILTEPLPAYVVMRLLGLEKNTLNQVTRWAMMGGDFLAGLLSSEQMTTIFNESAALHQFLNEHFSNIKNLHTSERGNSLTATLVGGVEDGLLNEQDAISISLVLFGAAGESTASLLGSAIRLLAENQQLQQQLRHNPAKIADFVEECVRLETPFKFHYRFAKHDTELCGTQIKKGDALLLGWAAANRDPEIFEEPEQPKLDRNKKLKHFGFGYGIHFCIGAPLARLEVGLALEELLKNTSSVTVDENKAYQFSPSIFVRRLEQLHIKLS